MKYKTDFIRIENLQQYILKEIKHFHPDDPRHTSYWKAEKKKCIEGVWGIESGGRRYMPGRLYFYGNFCTILDVDEAQNTRIRIKPDIRDIEWERAYMMLEAEGFSGWSDDDEYTSDILWFEYSVKLPDFKMMNDKLRPRALQLFNKEGRLKKYKPPRENIRQLHETPMGVPLYYNPSKNIIELGSRGGGKSYWYALAGIKHGLCFNGAKYYTREIIDRPPKAELCVGSGNKDKSSDFMKKVIDSLNELAINPDLGVWGKPSDESYEPNPFYKEMAGSWMPNNKDNLYRHEYKVIEKGRESTRGSGSYVAHVNYSVNKPTGAEAAAGGRYNILVYEEIGLTPLLTAAWGSNNSTVGVEGKQFGMQIGLGTSGNMETILPAKEIFTHPKQYNLVTYNDDWEESGPIGFFLPAYMVARDYKDKDGNTDIAGAVKFWEAETAKAAEADNPQILAMHKMNHPMVPSDMWQSNKGERLPVKEAEVREKQLMKGRLYEKVGTNIDLFWDSNQPSGVNYKIDNQAMPFYEPRYRYERDDLAGAIRIFEWPNLDDKTGVPPPDMYNFIGHDPYVSDNIDEGDSLGATYILLNPKYTPEGYNGNTIVASYIGKPSGGRREYYRNLEKLMAFYGNPIRGLWFEANRGDECKNYFMNRDKESLLALRPQRVKSANIYARQVTQYGYIVGNKVGKVELIDKFADWLLEPNELQDGTKLNIERIPCIFLIRQIQMFNLEHGNYDAVMAMLGVILGLREKEKEILEETNKENTHNPYAFLSVNDKLFQRHERTREARLKRFYGDDYYGLK
jgi:hypothetical protein